jgi:signal transduction histidine kinase
MLRSLDNALAQRMSLREVIVRATRQGDTVITAVRDFVPSVSEGNRDKIFRRFFSLRPSDARLGTGLGLSIVRAVVAAHGGRVEGQTPQDGPGALFIMTLAA